ncbi:hypothetical protein AgCh_019903 [Apium graveolens]
MATLVPKVSALLEKTLTVKQIKQIQALVLINGLNHLERLVVHRLLNSSNSYNRDTSKYLQLILQHMQNPDVSLWAHNIRFLSKHGQFVEAYAQYVHMQRSGLLPSTFAVSSALKACARVKDLWGGISIHAQIHKYAFFDDVYVETALVDFYSKLNDIETSRKIFDDMERKNVVSWNSLLIGYLKNGDLPLAQRFFDEIPEKDVISWNSMITGYLRTGDVDQAYSLFEKMPERNTASWNAIIGGYVNCGKIELARAYYDLMPKRNNVSCITMIAGYSRCGNVESANELFNQMDEKDQVLYNAMIACFAQNSRPQEALQLFNEMIQPRVNIQPDKMTFSSVISACSQLGDLCFGVWVESYMRKLEIRMDDHLATAFIDLYAKSGSIDKAFELFRGLRKKDLVAYTAMILGCGINGRDSDAIELFEKMIHSEISPNLVTFTGLLTAFNHVGMVEEGYHCFNSMKKYGLVPSADHYSLMVDLLGRAGRLVEAQDLIKSMPMQPHAGVWGSLLSACNLHNNVELGEIAAKHCFELEPDTTSYRSLLANIYSSAGRWDDAKRLQKAIHESGMEKGMAKISGSSWMGHS